MALEGSRIRKIILDFVNFFDGSNVPYVLVDGLAVNTYGRLRTTMDADFIIDHTKLHLDDFVDYLQRNDYENTSQDLRLGLAEGTNITIWSGVFRVDIKGNYNNCAKKSLDLAHNVMLFGVVIKVVSPELLVLSKLCYGSEQDFEDAASIFMRLVSQKRFDVEFFEEIGQQLKIDDRLALLDSLLNNHITADVLDEQIDKLKPYTFETLDDFTG